MEINRRQFIKASLTGLALSTFPIPMYSRAWAAATSNSPIQKIGQAELFSKDFNGDDIHRSHEVLWNIEGLIQSRGGIPVATEKTDVVIIGGGLAGLTAAYMLKDLNPIVLEQDKFFGGNAKGETYKDASYTIGSTYLTVPDEGSPLDQLYEELEILPQARLEAGADMKVFYKGQLVENFWQASTDLTARAQFQKIFSDLQAVHENGEVYTVFEGEPLTQELKELDQITFAQWLKQKYEKVHPHILEYFQLYCWSSFLTSIEEISTLQMLSFIAAETAEIMAFPGGNAALAQALYDRLPSKNLRSESIVVNVKPTKDGVEVCYDGVDRRLHTIHAKHCIFAGPKFIAKHVIPDLPDQQKKAMEMISYRAYIVANIVLDRPVRAPSFELYSLEGKELPQPTSFKPAKRGYTDLCFATWASDNKTQHGVLTVYNGLAHDGARQFLFNPGSHEKYKQRVINEVAPILNNLGLSEKNIHGLRLTRWGHSMPVAHAGLLGSGMANLAHQPLGNRIFFANQDNLLNPCYETAFHAARNVTDTIRSLL